MRKEKDFLGEKQIPAAALYGIHSVRASENFPDNTDFPEAWYRAMGFVKKACYLTYQSFVAETRRQYPERPPVDLIEDKIVDAMIKATEEIIEGKHYEQFIVPAISGGAGTSINMNINEIVANRSLQLCKKNPGDYAIIDPFAHANVFQSTNDTVPTALKVALMFELEHLEADINGLRQQLEQLENRHRNHLRIGYTQMQEAVPTSYGFLFSSYNDALSRDWWRVSKCFERLKVVNLGGGATGTGMAIPRYFIMHVVANLAQLTKLPVSRGENLPDTTSNLDNLVEVHAILKAYAVNLSKIASDLRMLSSDLHSRSGLHIPDRQVGSSIMPGKVNPVIPEFIISAAHRVYANDGIVSSLAAQGMLELNAYIPVIGNAMLESIRLLRSASFSMHHFLLDGLTIDETISQQTLFESPSITTALIPYTGYHKAAEMARLMKNEKIDIFEANKRLGIMKPEELLIRLRPESLLQQGYSIKDI